MDELTSGQDFPDRGEAELSDPTAVPDEVIVPSLDNAPAIQLDVEPEQFAQAFGESLKATLDLATWLPGENLAELYGRLEREVAEAAAQERGVRDQIREHVFPRLSDRPGAPVEAGVFRVRMEQLERIHRGLLFTGSVEACDGTSDVVDHLPLTIAQIGVCLVSYSGDQGSWVHRLFRRDLRVSGLDPVDEALEVLERRRGRAAFDTTSPRDRLSELARRGIMTYAERAVLLEKATAPWRMGHGSPAPYELLTGSGMSELADRSLLLLDRLISGHRRFVFVPSATQNRMWLTIGDALFPLEYAVIDSMTDQLDRIAEGHYRGEEWKGLKRRVRDFVHEVGDQLRVGVFRASEMAPPQVFYAHRDHVHEAAMIAIADSVLQEHRGFPVLIGLADTICRVTFAHGLLKKLSGVAYSAAGEPFRYLTERQTR